MQVHGHMWVNKAHTYVTMMGACDGDANKESAIHKYKLKFKKQKMRLMCVRAMCVMQFGRHMV